MATLPKSRAIELVSVGGQALPNPRPRREALTTALSNSILPSKCFCRKPAVRLAIFTNLPIKSEFTRAMKSSAVKSMSSTLALSLAAM